MRNDWIFDAVQAEVTYRTDELYRTGQATRPVRRRRRLLGRKRPEIRIPEQRKPADHDARS